MQNSLTIIKVYTSFKHFYQHPFAIIFNLQEGLVDKEKKVLQLFATSFLRNNKNFKESCRLLNVKDKSLLKSYKIIIGINSMQILKPVYKKQIKTTIKQFNYL
jgi:hypothetical protein